MPVCFSGVGFLIAETNLDGILLLDRTWVAVKELKLGYYIGESLLFTIDTHYGNPKP